MTTIQSKTGNLLEETGILVHGCNCQGVMGAGIADGIRKLWPDVYAAYVAQHRKSGLALGTCVVVASTHDRDEPWAAQLGDIAWTPQLPKGVVVVNAMTQEFFGRDPSKVYVDYPAVEACFKDTVRHLAEVTGMPVSFPLLGCGLANGKWEEVSSRIEKALPTSVSKTLVIYSPPK